MDKNTPLSKLAQAICGKHTYSIFRNQTIMYQVLIIFTGNKLHFSKYYSNTDSMLPYIKKYIYEAYSNNFSMDFSPLHKSICDTIIPPVDEDVDKNFNNSFGHNISYLDLNGTNLRTNINKVINNSRSLPHSLITELQKNYDNSDKLIKRIFWILQYFCTYYADSTLPEKNKYVNSNSDYAEFYTMNIEQRTYILMKLKEFCTSFSPILEATTPESMGFHIISRVVLDVIKAHLAFSNRVPLSALPTYTTKYDVADYATQLNTFQFYIDAFGQKTLDRFNILCKYAPTNFIAANELGNLYFYGDTLIFGGKNEYIIEPDYEKAIYYYNLSISNSNPPYPVACWSLGYILQAGYCSDNDNSKTNIDKAKYYFSLAGKYPPAICNLAKIILSETDSQINSLTREEIITQYSLALNMANEAATYDWFYGHNIIAQFLIKHEKDNELLNEIKKYINFPESFDSISQLKISCEYNNPWAIHALSMEYIKNNNLDAAKEYLIKACNLNYNKAFYSLAMNFYEGSKREELLKTASIYEFAPATYELAKIYITDKATCLALLDEAEHQNLSLHNVSKELQIKISNLRNKIKKESI